MDELFAALDHSIAEKPELKPQRRKELERLLEGSRQKAQQFVKDIERTVTEITAREEPAIDAVLHQFRGRPDHRTADSGF